MNVPSAHRILGLVLAACLAACLIILILASGTGAAAAKYPDRVSARDEVELTTVTSGWDDGSSDGWAISDAPTQTVTPTPTPTFTISGYKWHDLNTDSIYQEADEEGLNGWRIFIDEDGNGQPGDTEPWTETDKYGPEDGYYEFSGLESGVYTICEVLKDNWTQSFPVGDGCHSITLDAKDVGDKNFGNWQASTVSGYKYEDLKPDGKDKGEPRLGGWRIYVDYDGDFKWDENPPAEPSDVTDPDTGAYMIEGIKPGEWEVREVLQDGWTCTDPDPCYYEETFESGDEITSKNFGNYRVIRQLTDTEEVTNTQPSISGNGEWVAFVFDVEGDPEIWRTEVSSAVTQTVTASTEHVTNEFPSTNGDGTVIAFVSDGNLDPAVSNTDGNAEVFVAEPGTEWEITALTDTPGSIFPGFNLTPSIDDAGIHIALASDHDLQAGANADGNLEIFVATRGNGLPSFTQVTDSAACTSVRPSLSGNGRYVAFVSTCDLLLDGSNDDGNPEIFVAALDGSDAIVQVTTSGVGVSNAHPSISTLGKRIAYISDDDGNPELFVAELDLESLEVSSFTQVTHTDEGVGNDQPSISGSGQYVAFVSDADGNPEIRVAELDLESLQVISIPQVTDSDEAVTNAQPSISALGGRIAFISDGNLDPDSVNSDGNPEVFVATFATGNDIVVQKSASADLVAVSDPITFTITVQNYLGPPMPNVVLTDTLTSSVPMEKGDLIATQGSCGAWSGSTVTCDLGEIEAGDVIWLTLVVTPSLGGVITNTALVSTLGDPFPDNNEDTVVLWPARLYLPLILRGQ